MSQTLQAFEGLPDATISEQTSETNPGTGDAASLLSTETQERMEISLHRANLKKELMSVLNMKIS
jgi:hypothetical protein